MPAVTSPESLIIFTTSPTGLGHIRVMDALIDGLAPGSEYTIIGVTDVSAAKVHSLGSRVPILLKITEFIQNNPFLEKVVTSVYKFFFSTRTSSLKNELEKIKIAFPNKKNWIIVSTHFALAYPTVVLKKSLSKSLGVTISNVLVVTDDSPQRIWAVEGSDFIFTPSHSTENKLREFLKKDTKTIIETVSFPVSPRLTVKLSPKELDLLENQVDPDANMNLHISIPISGAGIQLEYLEKLIGILAREKFIFTIIGQITIYTKRFFEKLTSFPRVQVSTGVNAKATVKLYESSFFQDLRPACEITKPSEQSFKAILKPSERGGVILLLTEPVGRQENDNLRFLIRHELLANEVEQEKLEKYLVVDGKIPDDESNAIHYKASHWRALKLPKDPEGGAKFIRSAKSIGLLYSMLSYIPETKKDLTSDGVSQIWNTVSEVLKYRSERENTTSQAK